MTIFTRTRRTSPPAPAAPAAKAPVLAYNNPSASITVWADGNTWRLVIAPQNGSEGVQGVFTFRARVPAENAAKWLAYQDLTGIARDGMTWVELVDAIADSRDSGKVATLRTEVPGLSDTVIAEVLEVHYAQVLASKDARKVWAKLLRDAATVERAQQIRKAAR